MVPEKWKQRYGDFYEIYSVLCLPQRRNLLTKSQKVRGVTIMVERTHKEFLEGQTCPNMRQYSIFFPSEAMAEPDRKFSLQGSRPKKNF